MKTNLLQFLGAPVFTTVMATAAWGENLAHISQLLQTRRCPGCDLRGAGLVMTDLRDADLRGAALRGANLSRANLAGADLSGADLSNASLHGANLNGANLSNATLDNTDLRGAYLVGAYLEKVDLSKANVQGVVGLPSSVASAQQFYLWGVLEDRRGNFVGAANFYSQAISLEPNPSPCLSSQGGGEVSLWANPRGLERCGKSPELVPIPAKSGGVSPCHPFSATGKGPGGGRRQRWQ